MNLPSLLTTVMILTSSAAGLVFADELGIPIPYSRTTGDQYDECDADVHDHGDDEDEPDGNSSSNSTSGSGSGSSSSGSSSSGNTTTSNTTTSSSGNTTSSGNSTSAGSTSSSSNTTAADPDEATSEDDADTECTEEDGNVTAEPDGNETATDDNETAEPVEEPVAVEEAESDCSVDIDEWGDDMMPADRDWEWLVTSAADRLVVHFEAHGGLGDLTGGAPSVRLVDGEGRIVASGDSSNGGLAVDLDGARLTPGLWRLSYDSSALMSSYYVMVNLDC